MARTYLDEKTLKIGHPVYRVGTPQSPGKVLGMKDGTMGQRPVKLVSVLWLTGEESVIPSTQLRCLQSLIDDHKRKIETHKAAIAKLDRL